MTRCHYSSCKQLNSVGTRLKVKQPTFETFSLKTEQVFKSFTNRNHFRTEIKFYERTALSHTGYFMYL